MDHLTPATAALQKLTITDSLSPPTTALQNLAITATNTDKNKPRKRYHKFPSRTISREESYKLAHLTNLIRQWYGHPGPQPSSIAFAEKRMNQLRVQASKTGMHPENFRSLHLGFIRKRITHELSSMIEYKSQHTEKLELAKSYVQQRTNQKEVLSIIKSVYT